MTVKLPSESLNERNDCTVRATAWVCMVAYVDAHKACAAAGRKPRGRMRFGDEMHAVLRRFGYSARPVWDGRLRTPVSCERHLDPAKRYLVFVRGHVFAVVRGRVRDWATGRRHRVRAIYEVSRV